MSISRNPTKKYLIVGAGLIGMQMALRLHERFKDASIEVIDKRFMPGGRLEVLLLSDNSLKTLPEDVHSYLFKPDLHGNVKAYQSNSVYHLTGKLIPEKHAIIKINDLEHALGNALNNRMMFVSRGLQFITAENGIAQFKDLRTGALITKEYDELILSIGLSGALKASPEEKHVFALPRLLHSMPVVIARFAADFRDFDPIAHPATISYMLKDRMVGFFISPNSIATCISVPTPFLQELSSSINRDAVMLKFVTESLHEMPQEFQNQAYLKRTNFEKVEVIKYVPAVATLTPKLIDLEHNIHFIGDMVATFPYVWGSETNLAYNYFVPLLENLLVTLNHSDTKERHNHLLNYEQKLKAMITTNSYFTRLSPFGENIHLGQMLSDGSKSVYSFPGWEQLEMAPPYNDVSKKELMPLEELMSRQSLTPLNDPTNHKVQPASKKRSALTRAGFYAIPSDKSTDNHVEKHDTVSNDDTVHSLTL